MMSKATWQRQLAVTWQRGKLIPYIEAVTALILIIALIFAYYQVSIYQDAGTFLPASLNTSLLLSCLIPAMALLALIGRRLAVIRARRTIAQSTGRLPVRLVWLFTLIAAIPTTLVVLFASLLFQSVIQFWFSENSRGMIENANNLASGYYEQNLRDIGDQSVTMASDLRDYLNQAPISSQAFAEGYSYQVVARELSESAILERGADGVIRTAAIVDPSNRAEHVRASAAMIAELEKGEPVAVEASPDGIEALTYIDKQRGIFLYTVRNADTPALSEWKRAQSVLSDYDDISKRARTLQLRFSIALFFLSLLLVGIAVYAALRIADRLVSPLGDLVKAARTIGSGNYGTRITSRGGRDEIGLLTRAFNRMTTQIDRQTTDLITANETNESRRAFIEAVLESVTAGVISTDGEGRIRLINGSALRLLQLDSADVLDHAIGEISPQLAELVGEKATTSVLQHTRGGELQTLAVKIVHEPEGRVITFEDITRQIIDQRQAAWSDVARRIAHEIKNPLTPIQLATERLKRRYRKEIVSDPHIFDELTSTIVRQVGDLRKMVDEFSSFARLPKPVFRQECLVDLVRQAIFLQQMAAAEIEFSFTHTVSTAPFDCDRHQIGQALTNILKNAIEAIEARHQQKPDGQYHGQIVAELADDGRHITLAIADNGIGLPADRDRIVEPYITTREKGTGLGLAIVKKIVEEHGGELNFDAGIDGGARVILRFQHDLVANPTHHP